MALSLEELVSQAGFIFDGTLQRIAASTSSMLPLAPDLAVVRVTKIMKGPPSLSRFAGQEITIQLLQPATARVGERVMFFATSLHFGDGLAVREVGQLEVSRTVESEVRAAIEKRGDDLFAQRLREALLVIEGVAVRTEPWKPTTPGPRRVSEHDPDWWECVIKVRSVEKSDAKHPTGHPKGVLEVVTLFAKSIDILWYQSPKFSKGDEGIWLLHGKDLRGKAVPSPVSDHPLDFQPPSQIDRIRALLTKQP